MQPEASPKAHHLPVKHRAALLTVVGAYPTIIVLLAILNPLLEGTSIPMKAAVLVPLMVSLMTYVVMPVLNKFFKNWLTATSIAKTVPDRPDAARKSVQTETAGRVFEDRCKGNEVAEYSLAGRLVAHR